MHYTIVQGKGHLRASHEYIELLARQQKANVRAFRDEAAALDWLARQSQEKR